MHRCLGRRVFEDGHEVIPAMGLRKKEQETTCCSSGGLCEQGTEIGNTYGPGRGTRPLKAKILRRQPQKTNLRCRSASESVFAGILEQISRVSSTQKT